MKQKQPGNNISKDKREFSNWMIRQYFDPEKNLFSPWYTCDVDSDNVISKIKKKEIKSFPYTFSEISHMWKLISSIKKSLKKNENVSLIEDSESEKTKYQTGECTLRDIGSKINSGVTPTMVNNILNSGMTKIKRMTNSIPIDDLSIEQTTDLNSRIAYARKETSKIYSKELVDSKGNIKSFLHNLNKKKIVSQSETKHISNNETYGLIILSEKDAERIKCILLEDIDRADNLFKTFQSAVSRKAFSSINVPAVTDYDIN